MFAVIDFAGHQYKVQKGDKFAVNRLSEEEGSKITVENVLMTFSEDGSDAKVGTPNLSGAKVELKVLEHKKGDKKRVYKMKPKKRYRRNKGFRPSLSVVEVVSVA
jgi:large subunit ribosomal protein L21